MVEPKYLTFDEYEELGGALNEASFNPIEYRAEQKINLYTNNRLVNIPKKEIPKEVKLCVFDLISLIGNDTSNITSEKVGAYTITMKGRTEINNDTTATIKTYLSNLVVDKIPVLYCGVDED